MFLGNATLNFPEFVSFFIKQEGVLETTNHQEQFREFFDIIDSDGNGVISDAELKYTMTTVSEDVKLTDNQITEMIREADFDGNGYVNYKGNFLSESIWRRAFSKNFWTDGFWL